MTWTPDAISQRIGEIIEANKDRSLNDQMGAVAEFFSLEVMANDDNEELEQLFQNLTTSGILERAIKAPDFAPNFTLPAANGEEFLLENQLTKGPVVLVFYRGGWCPFCNLHLKGMEEVRKDIQELGGELIAVSPELPDNTLDTVRQTGVTYSLLSDIGNEISRQFGLVYQVSEGVQRMHEGFGIDLEAFNGDNSHELPLPATFIIRPDKKIVNAWIEINYTKRAEPIDVVTALGKLQQGATV